MEEDWGNNIPSWDLCIPPLFGTHWLTAPTSHFPPFGLYTQYYYVLGYKTGYVCLVELMSIDPIKTVLEWYKPNHFQIYYFYDQLKDSLEKI